MGAQMTRSNLAGVLAAVLGVITLAVVPFVVSAQTPSALPGRWTLNRESSEFPRDVGFAVDWALADGSGIGPSSGGRSGRGAGRGAARPFIPRRESEDDVKRVQVLTAEVRNPPAYLTITETATTVTITGDRGKSRVFHPDVREESIQLEGVGVGVNAKWEAGHLVVVYNVQQGRQLRYTYYQAPASSRLTVDVQFVERGGGDSVRRVYDPADPNQAWPPVPAPAPTATAAAAPAPRPAAAPPTAAPDSTRSAAQAPASPPAAPPVAEQPQNQRPGAELKGLTKLGIVVENLSAEATACGLSQNTLETTLSKRLTDAGFKVLRNSDEDSYVYVNINTAKLSTGLCVSRYDVFLYTHTTATLSYQQTPVLVQVSLLHSGGIGGGAPAAHAATVLRDLQEYVDQVATEIRSANRP
jgi:hypothetical protein